jgi:hypothetical protein
MTSSRRGNGEGSITAHRTGYQGRVRVTDPITEYLEAHLVIWRYAP